MFSAVNQSWKRLVSQNLLLSSLSKKNSSSFSFSSLGGKIFLSSSPPVPPSSLSFSFSSFFSNSLSSRSSFSPFSSSPSSPFTSSLGFRSSSFSSKKKEHLPIKRDPEEFEEDLLESIFSSFGSADEGGEVFLHKKDLKQLLLSIGFRPLTDKTLTNVLHRADLNGDGVISYEEFIEATTWLFHQEQSDEDLKLIFEMLDRDCNGTIEFSEVRGALSTTKKQITTEEAKLFFQTANLDPSASLPFESFKKLMRENHLLAWRLQTTFRVIFIIGGPASGKGTICSRLVDATDNFVHTSSGDLLRDEIIKQTPLGETIENTMKEGKLVDASIVLALLDKLLVSQRGKTVLLDGFPRSLQNAIDFVRLFGPGEGCVVFECPDEVMVDRIRKRGKNSGRPDDNTETGKKRVAIFHEQSKGPLSYFSSIGIPMHHVDTCQSIQHNVDYLLSLSMFKGSGGEREGREEEE